jgi:UDP-N-acetylmuramate--alanine ligase
LEPNVTAFTKIQSEEPLFGKLDGNLEGFEGRIHLLGIGGIGMSGLARLLLSRGLTVSGSDKSESEITRDLTNLGATVFIGHDSANVQSANAVAISTAIDPENPELSWARQHNIPVWHRSQVLGALTHRKKVVAVSGTHGKTTTTGMIAQALIDCKVDPTVVIGGIFGKIGANAKVGAGDYFVAESDESDGTHAHLKSSVAVVTNVEGDHLENYPGGIDEIYETMARFANNASRFVLLCRDDAGCRAIAPKIKGKIVWYGKRDSASDLNYSYVSGPGTSFTAFKGESKLGEIVLWVPGEHNKLNALGALAVGLEFGLPYNDIAKSLSNFHGVDRRFQHIGEAKGIRIVDDYAHHPTEIAATLKAARQYLNGQTNKPESGNRIVALFQPHQPRRLKDFWDEFCHCFSEADLVFVADIYVARGKQIPGVDSQEFVKQIAHKHATYLTGPVNELARQLAPYLLAGDLVITIGAGDVTNVGNQLLRVLNEK